MSRRWVDLGAFQAVGALQVLGVQRIGPEVHWCGNHGRAHGRDLVRIHKCHVVPAGIVLWPRWAPNPHHPRLGRVHAIESIPGLGPSRTALARPLHLYVIAQSLHPTGQASRIRRGIGLGVSHQARSVIGLDGEGAVLGEPFRKRLLLVHYRRVPRLASKRGGSVSHRPPKACIVASGLGIRMSRRRFTLRSRLFGHQVQPSVQPMTVRDE